MQQERLQYSMFCPVQKFVSIHRRLLRITASRLSRWREFSSKTQHYDQLLTMYDNATPLRHYNRVKGPGCCTAKPRERQQGRAEQSSLRVEGLASHTGGSPS